MAEAFRRHYAQKKNYIAKTGKDHTKRVNPNGFNPYALLVFARKTNTKNVKAPVTVLMTIAHYTHDDFNTWELPPKYFRWNHEHGCVEIAKRRYIAKGEKMPKDVQDREAWYYPPENELEFVLLPPGSNIEYSAFNSVIGADSEDGIVRIMDLAPKLKSAEQQQKYPDMPNWQWTIGSMQLRMGKFDPRAVPSIVNNLPAALFHLENPRRAAHMQRFVLAKLVDQFDNSIEKELSNKVFTFANLIFSGDDDAWAWESKEAVEQKKPWVPLPPDAPASAKKRTNKCMRLFAGIEQKGSAESQRVESISAKVVFWDNVIEHMFQIRDVERWFRVMRFVASLISPAFLVATVGRKGTEDCEWNQNADEGEAGEIVPLDDAEDEEGGAHAAPAAAAAAADQQVSASQQAADEDIDFASLVANKEAELKDKQNEQVAHEKIDFFLDLAVQKGVIDTYQFIRNYAIPVTAAWLKAPVSRPDGTKGIKDYIAPTNLKTGFSIDFKRPSNIPEVVCFSEHMNAENFNILNDMVGKGQGEYRVFVNTSTYVNETTSQAFVRAIRTLTPEEGAALLDGKPINRKNDKGETVPFNVTWVRPESASYVIYFLNHTARNTQGIKEAEEHAKKLLSQYIKPELITFKALPADDKAGGADGVPAAASAAPAAAAGTTATAVTDVLATIGAQSMAVDAPVQTDTAQASGLTGDLSMQQPQGESSAPTAVEKQKKRLQDEEKAAASGSDGEGADKDKRRKKRRDDESGSKHKKSSHK